MSVFNRYCISLSIFGGIFFVGMIALMVADGGELLDPFFLTVMVFVYICFVFFMSLLFYSFAKPVQINLKVDNKEYFLKQVSEISEKKWGRKQIEEHDGKWCYKFGNRYKDWLVTPMEILFDENECVILVPSYYAEQIYKISTR